MTTTITGAGFAASQLTGALPAISGASLTELKSGSGAFAARFNTAQWLPLADAIILPFNDDSTGDSFDTDGNYDTATYKYTAPATGVYMFWFSVYTAQSDTSNGFNLLKNTVELNMQPRSTNILAFAEGSDDKIVMFTCVVPLITGDTIAVQTTEASDVYTGHSQWGGCRLA